MTASFAYPLRTSMETTIGLLKVTTSAFTITAGVGLVGVVLGGTMMVAYLSGRNGKTVRSGKDSSVFPRNGGIGEERFREATI